MLLTLMLHPRDVPIRVCVWPIKPKNAAPTDRQKREREVCMCVCGEVLWCVMEWMEQRVEGGDGCVSALLAPAIAQEDVCVRTMYV